MEPTKIFWQESDQDHCAGSLGWHEGERLATLEEFNLADRCVGSIFEALEPGEKIELAEGVFELDEDLDPVPVEVFESFS